MGCNREIRFKCEKPLGQNDFRLFFIGLSSDIMEMPANGKICGRSLNHLEDKSPNYLLVYKKHLVSYGAINLDNTNDHFNLRFIIHPSQFDTTAILEIKYKNMNSPNNNYHKYEVIKLEDSSGNLPSDGSWAQAAWAQIEGQMN